MLFYNIPGVGLLAPGNPFSLATDLDGTSDLVKYPANWLEHATPEELQSRGIVPVEVPDEVPVEEAPAEEPISP